MLSKLEGACKWSQRKDVTPPSLNVMMTVPEHSTSGEKRYLIDFAPNNSMEAFISLDKLTMSSWEVYLVVDCNILGECLLPSSSSSVSDS